MINHNDPRYLRETITQIVKKTDPHAAVRAEYAKQVMEGTAKFYKWECKFDGYYDWSEVNVSAGFGSNKEYRCTDISCYVSKDGDTAIRMLRTEAQELQRQTKAGRIEVDPHAADRIKYAEQVKDGTRQFYLWEYRFSSNQAWAPLDHEEFFPDHRYRCTDISCMVALKGEPAVRMLRTEAQELQRELGDTVEWWTASGYHDNKGFAFNEKGTYTYAPKATIKLDGKMVTQEQALEEQATEIAELKAKLDLYLNERVRLSKELDELMPLAKMGAIILKTYKEGYVSDEEMGNFALSSGCLTQPVEAYAPDIEATITKLLKD